MNLTDRSHFVLPLAALVAAALCQACPGHLADPASFEDAGAPAAPAADSGSSAAACPDVPSIFTAKCATAGCHDATSKAGGVDLASPDPGGRLAGAKATGGPGLEIDPSNPSASVLYTKLRAPPPFGSQMPVGGAPFDAPTLACVLSWIGAQKGGSPPSPAPSSDDAGTDAAPPAPFTPIRVAAGRTQPVTDAANATWAADTGFSGGMTVVDNPPVTIANTQSNDLYNGERYGTFTYTFHVPDGTYSVTLKYAEVYVTAAGQRQFDVTINDTKVETNFDIYAAAGGMNAAVDRTYVTQSKNGAITIAFLTGAAQNPKVDAIAIQAGADAGAP